ncbi:hypothetical protein QNE97_001105 [Vibrio alginolyticus]|nr:MULTISPECIES: hypothetical protein [Vibrio]ELB2891608.1 hypothetical protein [Vibrio alginolyticus]MBS9930962.1 hypothetical protein [Vibrio alginolyticus]MDW1869474.1 hypothetical protein [Vibrio sp. Vb0598]
MVVPLIDIYPMQERAYTNQEISLHQRAMESGFETRPLREKYLIDTPDKHVEVAYKSFGTTILTHLIQKKLSCNSSYALACQGMPYLKDVPALSKYRKTPSKSDWIEVEREIGTFGKPLSSGQVLFHGGVYPRDENGVPCSEFSANRPLSTTLCAQVAAIHAGYHQPNEIWIITVSANSKTNAFVYRNSSRQTHGHETEFLLSSNAFFTLIAIEKFLNHTVYKVRLA